MQLETKHITFIILLAVTLIGCEEDENSFIDLSKNTGDLRCVPSTVSFQNNSPQKIEYNGANLIELLPIDDNIDYELNFSDSGRLSNVIKLSPSNTDELLVSAFYNDDMALTSLKVYNVVLDSNKINTVKNEGFLQLVNGNTNVEYIIENGRVSSYSIMNLDSTTSIQYKINYLDREYNNTVENLIAVLNDDSPGHIGLLNFFISKERDIISGIDVSTDEIEDLTYAKYSNEFDENGFLLAREGIIWYLNKETKVFSTEFVYNCD